MYTIRHITGHTLGLKPSHKKELDRLFLRRVAPHELISGQLAQHLARISAAIGRQVGVLINRQGRMEEAFVGDPHRIYLPDMGRSRAGLGHLRGLRHIHTVLSNQGLHRDDIADLTKLRLDAVCALETSADGAPGGIQYAYLLPNDAGISGHRPEPGAGHRPEPGAGHRPEPGAGHRAGHRIEQARSVSDVQLDFSQLMAALQAEQTRKSGIQYTQSHRDRAVMVGVYKDRATSVWRLAELQELAQTAGVEVADSLVQIRQQVDRHFVVGRGKLEEAILTCLEAGASLLIVDHNLTPAQARAIAAASELKVVDRTQLILDIFAQHAQSRDGKLQVELAQLQYMLPRLTDLDTGLSRLTGGIGGRGPGETKLEINRRRARDRMARLEREIEKLSQQRSLRRRQRQQGALPVVALVGYTNAGKSTLLNKLTHAHAGVADQLFATLDPTSRRLHFPPERQAERQAIITDTVGFIHDLPDTLIKAFRATLEELEDADLLLHVVDVADPRREAKMQAVSQQIDSLHLGNIPQLWVFNKSDAVPLYEATALAQQHHGVAVSGLTGQGLEHLLPCMAHRLWQTDAWDDNDTWVRQARQAMSYPLQVRPSIW